MASELFHQLWAAAYEREAGHLHDCRALWVNLGVHDIVTCSSLVAGLADLDAELEARLHATAIRTRMRIRRQCRDCGSLYCPGANITPEMEAAGYVFVHGSTEAEIAKKLAKKFGY